MYPEWPPERERQSVVGNRLRGLILRVLFPGKKTRRKKREAELLDMLHLAWGAGLLVPGAAPIRRGGILTGGVPLGGGSHQDYPSLATIRLVEGLQCCELGSNGLC